MEGKKSDVLAGVKKHIFSEKLPKSFFLICSFISIVSVASITLYMIIKGLPALQKVGIAEILFRSDWAPTAKEPSYGILFVILTSIAGTLAAVAIGVPIGVLTAVFLSEVAPKRLAKVVRPAVELLAGIPSVIYGLIGLMVLNPFMYQIELAVFKNSKTHQFTGGAKLLERVKFKQLFIYKFQQQNQVL